MLEDFLYNFSRCIGEYAVKDKMEFAVNLIAKADGYQFISVYELAEQGLINRIEERAFEELMWQISDYSSCLRTGRMALWRCAACLVDEVLFFNESNGHLLKVLQDQCTKDNRNRSA